MLINKTFIYIGTLGKTGDNHCNINLKLLNMEINKLCPTFSVFQSTVVFFQHVEKKKKKCYRYAGKSRTACNFFSSGEERLYSFKA